MRTARGMFQGMTLAELIIVIFVAAILAMIAWPNHTNCGPRPKVMRVERDLRLVAEAIEAYSTEHGAPPPMRRITEIEGDLVRMYPDHLMRTMTGIEDVRNPEDASQNVGLDPFRREMGAPYVYHTDGEGWILFSAGPDGGFDIKPEEDYEYGSAESRRRLILKTYDPTNGAGSDGDIHRTRE